MRSRAAYALHLVCLVAGLMAVLAVDDPLFNRGVRLHWCIPAGMKFRSGPWCRRPAGQVGARRAGVTVLALLAVTAALAVLLARWSHLAWPSVLVSILGTLPALYLAYMAVRVARPQESSVAVEPAHGRPAARWDPVDLGVHKVIGGGPMPPYVRRPHDDLLLAVLDPAVSASRLVVVRGGSSTGKTRAAYEAVMARLADWHLDYPLDPGALKARLETGVPARTVLWLGELRPYADANGGPAILSRVADLLDYDGRLIITTVWPEHWEDYAAAARAGLGAADPAGTVGLLLERLPELAGWDPAEIEPARGGVIDVPSSFTLAELDAAALTGDPVLAAAAVAAAGAGHAGQVAQYLAGVPDLLKRYEDPGGNPYGQAMITAAMDVTRLGHASPLPAALIQEAAVGYLTDPQRTKDIASWRETALAWAVKELRGTVRALQPIASESGTGVAGYQVADYLIQHATLKLRHAQVPISTWNAIVSHVGDPADAARLADSASSNRELYGYAIPLYRRASEIGDEHATRRLAELLVECGDLDGLRALAGAGDRYVVAKLVDLLAERGDLDGLRALVAADDQYAASRLLDLLLDLGDLNGAEQFLRGRGNLAPSMRIAELLWERGDLDGLRARADVGDEPAAFKLADLLRERGDLGGAVQVLSAVADADNVLASRRLAELLAERGDLDGLRARADDGDNWAAFKLTDLLRERGDLDEAILALSAVADNGDGYATSKLTELLAKGGDLDGPSRLRLPGNGEPLPGQLALPGMPSAVEPSNGQGILPGFEFPAGGSPGAGDQELAEVAAELGALDGDGARMAAAIRGALDMLLDGQHTGRYRWDQLHKTEKTHAGTLVEIALARALPLADGTALDYTIAGTDVDCKFSHRLGGWMIPPEAEAKLLLLVQASDEDGTWSAGLIRAGEENLSPAGNRDGKRTLNERGRATVRWLHFRAPLQENALIRLPERDVAAVFALTSGQQRVNELFRRAQRMRVSRTVVATVAMQDDYMKRVRDGGGARDQLRAEGIVIFGDYAGDQLLASALGLPKPGPGEFVSARLARRAPAPGDYIRAFRLDGADWVLAAASDPAEPAPALPR
jgi:hypothetical protein